MKAGRVIRIAIVIPAIDVKAKPFNSPAPAQYNGAKAAKLVK